MDVQRAFSQDAVEVQPVSLEDQIERYAELLVRKGVALQHQQELVVTGPIERADFVRLVVKQAYEAGAANVTVIWSDDELSRLSFQYHETSFFEEVPEWKCAQLNGLADAGAAFLFLSGSDPNGMRGIDPAKMATASRARNEKCATYRKALDFGKCAWCIAGVPVEAWARAVFPELDGREALTHLWRSILSAARADGPDPQEAWERHNAAFEKNKGILNGYAFDQLRYRSANGTDLTIGMNKGHLWMGGSTTAVNGRVFFPNIPTEEVFSSPDRTRAEGVVYSAMPLVHAGNMVDDFWLRFEDGKVVDFGAREGADVLRSIIETDEGSCRLGECALIAKDTPIRQSGLLFLNTLYDENASCHLALGRGFPECVEGGFEMSEEELMARGVNSSMTHVDFMIGADDLEVVGVTEIGEEVPVFLEGRWAWDKA